MCLLADICNHTWIPECGMERSDNSLRLFLDECDLYEYSCDYDLYYDILNYSDCFSGGVQTCPPPVKCPSAPTCPNHRFHRMGQHYFRVTEARRMGVMKPTTTIPNLPKHMLRGKRRYTPTPRCARAKPRHHPHSLTRKTTVRRTILKNIVKPTRKYPATKKMKRSTRRDTMVIKRETVLRNGKMMVKVIKGIASKTTASIKDDSDFLEK